MYAKNVAFPSGFFVEGETKELYCVLHALFLENEEKNNETKNR